jgi:GTP pyrophosphokinase
MESLKIDLFEDEVVVFTPKGEVKSLRKGATPVDFAYSVHSGIGDRTAGAKVNGRMVPLKYELKNGDIIEIITRSDSHPSRDWLNFVKTTKAKNRVRHYFRQQEREEKIKQGKVMLETELERCGANPSEVLKKETLQDTAQKLNLRSLEELLIQIGDGNLAVKTVAAKLGFTAPLAQMPKPGPVPSAGTISKTSDGIAVSGLEGLVVRFAQCCHPIPGDPIEGYITQGRGVSIHRKDCPNLHAMRTEPGRSIQVAWSEVKKIEHALQLIVTAQDRERLLADMLQVFYDSNTAVKGANTRIIQGNLVEAVFTVQVADLRHLETLMHGLRRVKNVLEVGRKGNF